MKLKRWLVFFFAVGFLTSSMAQIITRSEPRSRASASGSGSRAVIATSTSSQASCNERDLVNNKLVPLQQLQELLDDPDGIDVKVDEQGRGKITLPPHISNCFEPEGHVEQTDGEVLVGIKNVFNFDKESLFGEGLDGIASAFVSSDSFSKSDMFNAFDAYTDRSGDHKRLAPSEWRNFTKEQMIEAIGDLSPSVQKEYEHALFNRIDKIGIKSINDKYARCLKQQGVLTENGQFDVSSSKVERSSEKGINFSLRVNSNTPSMKLFFVNPYSQGEDVGEPPYGFAENGTNLAKDSQSSFSCGKKTKLAENDIYVFESEADRQRRLAYEACKRGDAKSLVQQLEEQFEDIIEPFKKIIENDNDRILAEIDEVNQALGLGDDGSQLSRRDAREEIERYENLLKEWRGKVFAPAVDALRRLLAKREERSTTRSERAEIDKEIEELNKLIGEYARKNGELDNIYAALQEHGFTSEARYALETDALSQTFSRVYEGRQDERGRQLTLSGNGRRGSANRRVNDRMKEVDRLLQRWDRISRTRRGDRSAIEDLEKRRQNASERGNNRRERFITQERELQASQCETRRSFWTGEVSYRFPSQCADFMRNRQARYDSFLTDFNFYQNTANGFDSEINLLNGYYAEGQRRLAANRQQGAVLDGFADPLGLFSSPLQPARGIPGVQQPVGPTGIAGFNPSNISQDFQRFFSTGNSSIDPRFSLIQNRLPASGGFSFQNGVGGGQGISGFPQATSGYYPAQLFGSQPQIPTIGGGAHFNLSGGIGGFTSTPFLNVNQGIQGNQGGLIGVPRR